LEAVVSIGGERSSTCSESVAYVLLADGMASEMPSTAPTFQEFAVSPRTLHVEHGQRLGPGSPDVSGFQGLRDRILRAASSYRRSESPCFRAVEAVYFSNYFSQGIDASNAFSLFSQSAQGNLEPNIADYYNTTVSLLGLNVLTALNNTIQKVANANGATYVPLSNFTGHSFCDSYTPTLFDFILAPRATGSVAINWKLIHKFVPLDVTPSTDCDPSPGCYVKSFSASGTKALQAGLTIQYSLFAELNDFPRLTPVGQVAIAADINDHLP
jgi:hypothetical protein